MPLPRSAPQLARRTSASPPPRLCSLFQPFSREDRPETRRLPGAGDIYHDDENVISGELAEVMHRFSEGDFDILLCTTIIESGLDIPRANTILINRADALGLAQLYQLRGRVGRGSVRGQCLLLLPVCLRAGLYLRVGKHSDRFFCPQAVL